MIARISLDPKKPTVESLRGRELIALQHRLNAKFVRMRDAGENVTAIYSQLKMVERRCDRLGLYW